MYRPIGWLSRVPAPLAYGVLVVLVVLATMPIWRLAAFGMTLEDWLQLRCF